MTKRITADHVKLKRAYEPATTNDETRMLIDRLWPRGSDGNISTGHKTNCRMDRIGIRSNARLNLYFDVREHAMGRP
jgi:hypothetical protein